jgi:glycosyltransferase involved in cell wall biosynthesis
MLPVFETYFTRFEAFPQRLSESVKKNVGIIVAIPCYNEPDILKTLQSLLDCEKTDCAVEIIVAVNYSETASQSVKDFNASTYKELCYFAKTNSSETCKVLPILASDIPAKQAGVGYARKIAMDEATHRFASIDNPDGIIVACDSDSLVANNYLREIEQYYITHPTCTAANIYFEHPLEGKLPSAQYEAIAQYELHLRYYVEQLKRIGFPYAYHTVGSSFSLRAKAYCRQGGMNKRQAGEDFYFLQKLFQTEHIGEINTTTIFPSSRISDRVPFGTGFAMGKLMTMEHPLYLSYSNESFSVLQEFFSLIAELRQKDNIKTLYASLHPSLRDFIPFTEFEKKISEIKKNTATEAQFRKRFFNWFNGFQIFKYLNFCHTQTFEKRPITTVAAELIHSTPNSTFAVLNEYRTKERGDLTP